MLLPRHERVFWTEFRDRFEFLPTEISYNDLYLRCETIREFRNRVFHHEPIFLLNLTQEYSHILGFIRWLSPEKAKWIKQYSRAMLVLRQKP